MADPALDEMNRHLAALVGIAQKQTTALHSVLGRLEDIQKLLQDATKDKDRQGS